MQNSDTMQALIQASSEKRTLMEADTLKGVDWSSSEIKTIVEFLEDHQNYRSYHLLFGLKFSSSDASYALIPATVKANILCSALSNQSFYNDWSILDLEESYDRVAGEELVSMGEEAIGCLVPLLSNDQPALLFGGEEATLSMIYGYRVNDFVFRYLNQIRGTSAPFLADPEERDPMIKKLLSELE